MGFGYGLSYSKFSYSNLQVPCSDVSKNGVVNVTVDVTNTSERAGDEIVFLFVSYGHTTSPRRAAQGAEGVQARQPGGAEPGRSRRGRRARQANHAAVAGEGSEVLGHDRQRWAIESGDVRVIVAPSAAAANDALAAPALSARAARAADCALTDTFRVN